MKLLIAGATGLVGKAVLNHLWLQGHDLRVLSRTPLKARRHFGVPVQLEGWDGKKTLEPGVFKGVDAVLNFAGEPIADRAWTPPRKRALLESRTLTTRAIVQGISALPPAERPKVLINASAIGYYGPRGDTTLDEHASPGTGFLSEVCQAWETEAHEAPSGVRVVCLRFGVVLSREGGAFPKMLLPFQLGLGGTVGSTGTWLSWIHIADLTRVVSLALDSGAKLPLAGAVNTVAPEPVVQRTWARELARAAKRSAWTFVPKTLLTLLGERHHLLTDSVRAVPRKLQQAGFEFQFPTLSGAFHDLLGPSGDADVLTKEQWVPKPIQEVFGFFSDEKNLETLTPPWLKFRVVGKTTPEIGEGTCIDYRIRVRGVPMRWRSQIEDWREERRFVDQQLRGPYAFWHHTHDFVPARGGTFLRDRVCFRVPGGRLGRLVVHPLVRKDVERIFDFRMSKIRQLFAT